MGDREEKMDDSENMDDMTSSTMKINRQDLKIKSIPVICSWCNALFRISEWELDEEKTKPSHGICENCKEKMKEQAKLNQKNTEE